MEEEIEKRENYSRTFDKNASKLPKKKHIVNMYFKSFGQNTINTLQKSDVLIDSHYLLEDEIL